MVGAASAMRPPGTFPEELGGDPCLLQEVSKLHPQARLFANYQQCLPNTFELFAPDRFRGLNCRKAISPLSASYGPATVLRCVVTLFLAQTISPPH
jgi:hypothetical protein